MWFYISQNKSDESVAYTFNVQFTAVDSNTFLQVSFSMNGKTQAYSYSVPSGQSSYTVSLTADKLFESGTNLKMVTFELLSKSGTTMASATKRATSNVYEYDVTLVSVSKRFTINWVSQIDFDFYATFNNTILEYNFGRFENGNGTIYFDFSDIGLTEGDIMTFHAQSWEVPITIYLTTPQSAILTDGGTVDVAITLVPQA